ncbi:hypothetical protein AB0M46_29675 [Dactylosporangium sp. NPDC051485]|uniref:hypothetical protein n=1 Tax=Dactylosporangium sp. NPDC051485 TaxID=3154846 RepID=UPI0034356788
MLPSASHADGGVIELGLIRDAPAIDADRDPAGLPRGWGLLLALGLVLCLVSAAPMPPAPREVARLPLRNGAFHLVGGVLLLLENDRAPTPVDAFDGGGGTAMWTYTPEGLTTLSYAAAAQGVVVLWPDLCRSGVTGTTVALDLRTGRERWHASGVPVRTAGSVPGTVILRSLWSDGCEALAANAPIGGVLRWQALDADGRALWEVPVDAGSRVALDSAEDGAAWAALADRQGEVSIADFATGARTRAGSLQVAPGDLMLAAGGLLVLVSFDGAGTSAALSAYRRGEYSAPAWRARVPTGPASTGSSRFAVRPCGRALCVLGRRTVVLDPADGAALWSTGGRSDLAAVPGGLLAAAGARPVALLDPSTGATVVRLGDWELLGVDGPVSGTAATTPAATGSHEPGANGRRMLLGTASGDGTLLGFRAGPGVAPLVTVDARLVGCELDGDLIACRTSQDEVVLLRLPA